MKIILNMSMSLNAIVARENDSTNFLTHGEWPLFVGMAQQTGAILWGRRTHEVIRSYGEQVMNGFDGLSRVVLSRNARFEAGPGWQVATSPQEAIAVFSAAGRTQALLGGGPTTNTAFVAAGLLDEVALFVGSVAVGQGRPLFAPQGFDLKTHLIEMKQAGDEIVLLRYQVIREG